MADKLNIIADLYSREPKKKPKDINQKLKDEAFDPDYKEDQEAVVSPQKKLNKSMKKAFE